MYVNVNVKVPHSAMGDLRGPCFTDQSRTDERADNKANITDGQEEVRKKGSEQSVCRFGKRDTL